MRLGEIKKVVQRQSGLTPRGAESALGAGTLNGIAVLSRCRQSR